MWWRIPKDGDKRDIKRFALLPIKGDGKMYWLEWVYMWQYYDEESHSWITTWLVGEDEE